MRRKTNPIFAPSQIDRGRMNFKKLRKMIEEKGNGTISSREIPVSSFIRLHIATNGVTNLIQGDEEKLVVEADENLLKYFEAMNSGRTLYISSDAGLRKPAFTHCKVDVYFRQLDTLQISCD